MSHDFNYAQVENYVWPMVDEDFIIKLNFIVITRRADDSLVYCDESL